MTITILIVVEHDCLRNTLEMWLRQTFPKCHVRAVINETKAIDLALVDPPQLIVIDAGLSEAKIFEAIKRIKAILPATAILVLTSYDSEIHLSHALACGASACFSKEAMLTDLQPTIAALLAPTTESKDRRKEEHRREANGRNYSRNSRVRNCSP